MKVKVQIIDGNGGRGWSTQLPGRESFCYLGAKYDGVYSGLKSKITARIHLGASRVVFIQLTVTCMYVLA